MIAGIGKGKKPLCVLKHRLDTPRKTIWYDRPMLEGKCPKCGSRYFGWALRLPRHQTCPKCGVGLDIIEDGRAVSTGYSPFTAERYLVNPPADVPPVEEKESGVQDE